MSAANLVPIAHAWGRSRIETRGNLNHHRVLAFSAKRQAGLCHNFPFLKLKRREKCQVVSTTPEGKLDAFWRLLKVNYSSICSHMELSFWDIPDSKPLSQSAWFRHMPWGWQHPLRRICNCRCWLPLLQYILPLLLREGPFPPWPSRPHLWALCLLGFRRADKS